MKKLVLALAPVLFAQTAQASYLEACTFTGTVAAVAYAPTLGASVNALQPVATIVLETAENHGSHIPTACDRHIGKEKVLLLAEGVRVEAGQAVELEYFHVNNRGPNGVVFSERWTLAN